MSAVLRASPVRLRAIRKNTEPQASQIFRLADKLEPDLQRAFLEAFEALQGIPEAELLEAALERNLAGLITEADFAEAQTAFRAIAEQAMFGAADIASKFLVQEIGVEISFVGSNPRAIAFLNNRGGELIKEISESTRKGVRAIVQRGIAEGNAPAAMAKEIKQIVGLTKNQAMSVRNFKTKEFLRLLDSGATFAQAEAKIDILVERQTKKLIARRATNIARTELIRATNAGQREMWEQAFESGQMPPRNLVNRQWSANLDDRVDPDCFELDGTIIPFDSTFDFGDPPIHVDCRCAIILDFTKGSPQSVAPPSVPIPLAPAASSFAGPTITVAQSAEFLSSSKIPNPVVHRTSKSSASSIRNGGVDFSKTTTRSTFGEGFYTSEQAITFYGDEQLSIAIRSKNPFRGTAQQMDDKITSFALRAPEKTLESAAGQIKVRFWAEGEQQRAIRQSFLNEGVDALIIEGGGNNIIVGLVEDNIKVIVGG